MALLLALVLVPAGSSAQSRHWIGWDLRCETSRIAIGEDQWSWMRIHGLTPILAEGRQLTALADSASIVLLLRADDNERTVFLDARSQAARGRLALAVNGVELGAKPLRKRWKTLDYRLPAGTLVQGPNVVRVEWLGTASDASNSAGVLLHRIAVEPSAHCRDRSPLQVDPEVRKTLPPESSLVIPQPWTTGSELSMRILTRWPRSSVSAFCVGDSQARLITTLAGGQSRRAGTTVRLASSCVTGAGLVLVANGPGPVELRQLDVGPPGPLWSKLLGARLLAGLGVLGLALLGASTLAGRLGATRGTHGGSRALFLAGGDFVLRVARSPFFWLVVVVWLAFFTALDNGELWAERVKDTANYEDMVSTGTPGGPLASARTIGYPILLRLAGWEQWGLERVPVAHALSYGLAMLVFWLGLRGYVGSGWLAFWATLPLVASPILRIIRRVQPDFMGGVWSLVVLGVLFQLATGRRRWRKSLWLLLAFATFAAYQTRPAVIFLIGYVPLAAVLLWMAKHGFRDRRLRRFAIASSVAVLVPFFLFSGLRWLQVGHFGLVSYGGFQVIGVTTPMLDEQLAAELPEHLRPLAEGMVEQMRRQGLATYEPGSPLDYWYKYYTFYVLRVALPEARKIYEPDGPRPLGLIEINDAFTELSFAIIARRPGLYLDWIVRCSADAVGRTLREPTVRWPSALLAIAGLSYLARRRRFEAPGPVARGRLRVLCGLALAAITYYSIQLLLVVSVEELLDRYYVCIVFLIPCSLCAFAFELSRWALRPEERS